MNALDVYTKRNIYDYLARPEKNTIKKYSEERQKIREYIRKDDLEAKKGHPNGQIDWGYLLQMRTDSNFPKLAGFFSNLVKVVFYIHL